MDRTISTGELELDTSQTQALALSIVGHPDPGVVGLRQFVGSAPIKVGRGAASFGAGALDDQRLSRAHFEVRQVGHGAVVEDAGSRNGTAVNGAGIKRHQLCDGDVITAGRCAFLLHLAQPGPTPRPAFGVLGVSDAIEEVRQRVRLVAQRDTTVLLLGETGVGKEVVARALHAASLRSGELVAVNCGGLDDSRIQDDLFGHEAAAYTGARGARPGLVERAGAGTLFLDEIGDASPSLQVSLLRLLQERTYYPMGSDRARTARCRFVAATHQDLEGEGFRTDLRMRLARWEIWVPALRERRVDVGVLAHHFAARHAGRPVALRPRLALALVRSEWPGNVRELDATLERLVIEQPGVEALDLTPSVQAGLQPMAATTAAVAPTGRPTRPDAAGLQALFTTHEGKVSAVAKALGIGRNTLYRWVDEAGLSLSDLRS